MLEPIEIERDLSKTPFLGFTLDELPDSVAEQIHDLPPGTDREFWQALSKKHIFNQVTGTGVSKPDNLEPPVSNEDWCFFQGVYDYSSEMYGGPFDRYSLRNYMATHKYEWQLENGSPIWPLEARNDRYPEFVSPLKLKAGINRKFEDTRFGFDAIRTLGPLRIMPLFDPKARKLPFLELDPTGFDGPIQGFFCSPEVEAQFRAFTDGGVDTLDVSFEQGEVRVPEIWQNWRPVALLARWLPFDLERSMIAWSHNHGKYWISKIHYPVLRDDIPPEISIIVPPIYDHITLMRKSAIQWLDGRNDFSSQGTNITKKSYGQPLSELEWTPGPSRKLWREGL